MVLDNFVAESNQKNQSSILGRKPKDLSKELPPPLAGVFVCIFRGFLGI